MGVGVAVTDQGDPLMATRLCLVVTDDLAGTVAK